MTSDSSPLLETQDTLISSKPYNFPGTIGCYDRFLYCYLSKQTLNGEEIYSYNQLLNDCVSYNEDNPHHEELLRTLWRKFMPDIIPTNDLKDKKWKDFGFQVFCLLK